jgi:carbon-monoxide dehydrogenase large subunit
MATDPRRHYPDRRTIGAPGAVIHAILDALASLGVTHLDMPATPERVWRAIREAGATR